MPNAPTLPDRPFRGAMERRILIPITAEEVNKAVVRRADMWGERTGAELRFLYVRRQVDQTDGVFSLGGMSADSEKKREEDYERMERFLEGLDIKSQYGITVRRGAVSSQIVEEERSYKPDLIIFAALSDTIIARLFLDSRTDYSVHHSNCPIFIYKSTMQQENNRILVPVDYGEIDRKVAAIADEWAKRTKSQLYFLHVAPLPENAQFSGQHVWIEDRSGSREERRKGSRVRNLSLEERRRLESFLQSVGIVSEYETVVEFGEVNLKILEVQNRLRSNLMALSTHIQATGSHTFIGGNTDYLLHYTDCSIYLYKEWRDSSAQFAPS